jgi:EmrB/QacA subfamily drug resistance transporter
MSSDHPYVAPADRKLIVIGALVAMFLAALDQTIVAPSLPTLGNALGDAHWVSWVVSIYLLTATAITPLYGKLADIRGRRPTLYSGLGIFLAGSVICALAPNMIVLIIGRAIQGLGGGGIIAVSQTIVADAVPPRERGHYAVYISGLWATASIAGPILGGVLTQYVHWSAIFWVNLPIGAVAIIMAIKALAKLPDVRRPHRLDLIGSALVMAATAAIMLGLTLGGKGDGWLSLPVLGLIVLGVVLYVLFWQHLGRAAEPLVPPRVIVNPVVLPGLASLFCSMGVNVGLTVYTPSFLEGVHGLTPAEAGFVLMSFLLGSVGGAGSTGRRIRTTSHYRRLAVSGCIVTLVSLVVFAVALPWLPLYGVIFGLFVVGYGLGTNFPVLTVSVQNAVERRDLGVATAGLGFVRTLGGIFGVAVFGALMLSLGAAGVMEGEAAHVDAASTAALMSAYRAILVACIVVQVMATAFILLMEERPLRGDPVSATAE